MEMVEEGTIIVLDVLGSSYVACSRAIKFSYCFEVKVIPAALS